MHELMVVARLFPEVQSGDKTSNMRWHENPIVPGPMTYRCEGEPERTVVVWVAGVTDVVLSQAAARGMVSNQNPAHLDAPWGVGWALRDSKVWAFFGEQVSARTFGHVGATGTVAWADPESELICVCLTNVKIQGGSLLRRVSNAVAAAVVD